VQTVGLLANPFSGTGRERVVALARAAYDCLSPQANVLVGPGDMGAPGGTVVGTDATLTRRDTIDTTRAMIDAGAELLVIVSGDGTYNDALEGMKAAGATVPILGIAAGRFNTQYPKRRHDPFVSLRGEVRPFRLDDVTVEDVPGLEVRIGGEVAGYGFFWTTISNGLAYTDPAGTFMVVDAARMLVGDVVALTTPWPVATDDTRIDVGAAELARGASITMPVVAQIVPELNQILAGGFGAFAEFMGFAGVAYTFTNPAMLFLPTPDLFPVETRSTAFAADEEVRLTGLRDGAVLQIDSTPVRTLRASDVVTVRVVPALGKKARI
jgi:hypothetical protein